MHENYKPSKTNSNDHWDTGNDRINTGAPHDNPFEDAIIKDAGIGLTAALAQVPISYKPANASELKATIDMKFYYISLADSVQEVHKQEKYLKIVKVLEKRIADMEERLLYEFKE